MRGLFVTGTGTGVGKTVLSAAIVAGLRRQGLDVVARKPVVTGLDDSPDPDWPPDHVLLALASGADPSEVALQTFGPAVSPHLAAQLSRRPIDPAGVAAALRAAVGDDDGDRVLVVEGVGGLLVPLTDDYSVRDLAVALGLPLVVAASPGLGTINHTLLTLESARAAGLRPLAVVLTPWPAEPDQISLSNRETIAQIGGVAVETLPEIRRGDPQLLAAAGAHLPLAEWIGASPS